MGLHLRSSAPVQRRAGGFYGTPPGLTIFLFFFITLVPHARILCYYDGIVFAVFERTRCKAVVIK